ncbi:GRAM domain-containing protein 2A-like [Plectropomus leopardus]|uniref:GRAM domain-containing protein 2A-like n=1 Tax=Plectropomus leopardus TaxID=160734 RepID=UPI001C4CE059|nr:GRAM domain-containing protein 2A-like [Plectropomus leopardus]
MLSSFEAFSVVSVFVVSDGNRKAGSLRLTQKKDSQTVSKYNSQYHKLFQTVPKEEILMKVYSCALLRDILLQGRLYISRNWLCFYANLFGKDIKVSEDAVIRPKCPLDV